MEGRLRRRLDALEQAERSASFPEALAEARATVDAQSLDELGGWAYTYVATYQAETDFAEPVEPVTPGYRRWLNLGGLERFMEADEAYQALPEKRRAEIVAGTGMHPRLDAAGEPLLTALGISGDRARAMSQGMLALERAAAEGRQTCEDIYE